MNWFVWDDTLVTGHGAMDADHAEFARLFNLLPEAIEQGRGKDYCCGVIDRIIELARAHFEREQALMREHGYERTAQHAAEHVMLLNQALRYRADFAAQATQPGVELSHFPEVWLAFHILFSDKDFARFLAARA